MKGGLLPRHPCNFLDARSGRKVDGLSRGAVGRIKLLVAGPRRCPGNSGLLEESRAHAAANYSLSR